MDRNLTWDEVLKAAEKIPKITLQEILAHPRGYNKIANMVREQEDQGIAPFGSLYGMPIHMAPWMPDDQYLLADHKMVEILQGVAEKFGGEVARMLVERLLADQGEKDE